MPSEQVMQIRQSRGRRLTSVVLLVLVVGLLPLFGVIALAVSGGVGGWLGAAAILLIQVALFVPSVQNIGQRWVIDDHALTLRRPGRAPLSWSREGLRYDIVSTPVYSRGIRAGTQRILNLVTGEGERVKRNITALGQSGASRLSSALRAPTRNRRSPRRRVDATYTLDRSAIARYRRHRRKWRAAGVAVVVAGVALIGIDDEFRGFWDFASFGIAFIVAWYLIESVGRQLLAARRSSPDSIRVTTDHVVVVDKKSRPMGERVAWAELDRVELSADIEGEVVLRLCRRSGVQSVYSLTAGVGEDVREDVAPWFEDLQEDLHAVLDHQGIPMVDLER